jgi:HK97 family phage major capsid protein
MTDELHSRVMPLDDGTSVSGRTICAYAAVFNRWTPIHDQDGDYEERIAPGAFAAGLAQRGDRIFSVYHHGRNLDGSPSAENSVPYGTPVVSREDHRGWYTETLVNEGPDGDRLLAAVRNVDPATGKRALGGLSFTGIFLRTTPPKPPGGYRRDPATGRLPQVTRHEILPIEYGLTPMPAYPEAEVVGVRAESSHGGPAEYTRQDGEDVQCPSCLKYNDDHAEFCDQCGAALPGWGQPNEMPLLGGPGGPDADHEPGATVHCANCGAWNMPDARYCDQCGRMLANSAYDAVTAGATSSSGREPAGTERAMMSDIDGDNDSAPAVPAGEEGHGRAIGRHSHQHNSHSGPDVNGDGKHDHEHTHYDDADHDHAHRVSVSGRAKLAIVAAAYDLTVEQAERLDPAVAVRLATGLRAERGGDAPGDGSKPYGNVEYADPGYQSDKQKRYPIDTDAHATAAWGYINQADNAGKYSADDLKKVKDKIEAAMHKFGHQTEDDDAGKAKSTSSSGRQPESQGTASRSAAGPQVRSSGNDRTTHEGGSTMPEQTMSVEERAARQSEIRRRQEELNAEFAGAALPADRQSEWDSLAAENGMHEEAIRAQTARTQYLMAMASRQGSGVPGYDPDSGYAQQSADDNGHQPPQRTAFGGTLVPSSRQLDKDIWDMASARTYARTVDDLPQIYRDRAMRVLEFGRFPGERARNREDIQGRVEGLLNLSDDPTGFVAQRILSTGSDAYRRAFGKILAKGIESLNSEEQLALQRALTIGTPASFGPGSYPVPYQVDPTVTLTSNGAINALRQVSRVEQIVGREWLGVTSTGIVVTRGTEAATVTDATASPFGMSQPGVAANRVQAFVPFSVEVEQDWNGLLAEISMMLADAKDIEEAGSFLTGNGTAPNPQGIMTGIAGAPQQVLTATTAVTAIADVYNVETQMAPRFRAQSNWLASKGGYNALRQLWTQVASAAGDPWVRPSAGTPAEFLGYPANENSNMATSATTSGNQPAVLGDFKQFLIVDRIGMSVELVPHLFNQAVAGAGTGMPTGQRGIFAMWRNNSIVLVPNAFRYLQVR